MKKRQLLFILLSIAAMMPVCAQGNASFSPGEIWKDNNGVHINAHGGGILYFENKYYWFGEHKIEGEKGNTAQVGVHCYSSVDLYHWKDEGIALKVSDDPNSPITKGCVLERPKVIYNKKTRQFVMWFHLEQKGKGYSSAMAGIAQASKVTGPFTFIRATRANPKTYPVNVLDLHKRPSIAPMVDNIKRNEHPDTLNLIGRDFKEGQMSRDMQLFVDDDGKAYHIFASESNSTLHISELTDNYLDYSGKWVRAFINRFMEAPAIFKKDGLYYLMCSDCTGWRPNAARSAVAPSIWGPWTELGNPCEGADAETTYHSQSTYILPVAGKKDAFIYMGDRWNPSNAIDGRYIWLPIDFKDGKFKIRWQDHWSLSSFK
ncbi:MAG: glycoside hydrolase family 43 protein [Bacteroidales bacterium]|nr:glycoside hydrolase family 43 protein [Bacteroidales bacterium]